MGPVHVVADSSARLPDPDLWDHPLLTPAVVTVRTEASVEPEDPRRPLHAYPSIFLDGDPPQSEPPSVEELAQTYGRIFRESNEILSLHTAPAVSRALHNAKQASQRYLGRCDIHVVDSQTVSAGLGLLVEAALKAAERGQPLEDVVRVVRSMIPRLYLVAFLDDLSYLERHSLITRSQAILGNMLGVIAFLTMEDGNLIPMEKVRSRPRALEKLVEFVAEFTALDHIALLQPTARGTDDGLWVADRLETLHPETRLTFADYGPSTATMVGPNSLGVIVLESQDEVL